MYISPRLDSNQRPMEIYNNYNPLLYQLSYKEEKYSQRGSNPRPRRNLGY